MATKQNGLTICLWFEKSAEEAAKFYVDLFNGVKNHSGRSGDLAKYSEASSDASGQPQGSTMTVTFELDDQKFMGLNGGPLDGFKFSGATSFVINCDAQEEIDYFWDKLGGNGGETGQCGWINRDKFGITWQIVPSMLGDIMGSGDAAAGERVMKELMAMKKIDIATLKKAAGMK